ncbi:origin recognition complex subunit 2-like [Uloborus diversus]|uniref:origin recognition complex subunit 2-like n=1 Tax=Uloborus diversus TaxID=327109 RepID=UPI00240A6088|nr:origin recognition complex subunit 2-like [Uloborus diversus]
MLRSKSIKNKSVKKSPRKRSVSEKPARSKNDLCCANTEKPEPEISDEKHGYVLRQKIKQELASLKLQNIDTDPEDSDETNSDETDTDSDFEFRSEDACETPKLQKKNSVNAFSESYFRAQRQKKCSTSNKTLSNVKIEKTNIKELKEILESVPEYHKKEKDDFYKTYSVHFSKWKLLLREGFNVLLYGLGSKQKILNYFMTEALTNSLCLVIYGFFPSLNVKQMLSSITEDALNHEGKFSSIQDHLEFIKQYFSKNKENLYIIIHNIDGVLLRSTKSQTVLSSLAAVSNIHFICSVDHINSPLIWDQVMLSRYKWLWYDATTFEPYILETSYEDFLLKDQSSHLLLSSLLHVYNSLTPNGRGVFKILAQYQKDEKKNNSGMPFHEWYQECREAFLVNSEITMQAQLSEFKNHKLLASRKSSEGIEVWYIPVDLATLEQFLENCE